MVVLAVLGAGLSCPDASAATQPTLTVEDATIAEGNRGTGVANVVVSLSAASTNEVTVRYVVGDGSGTAPVDYRRASGTLTFSPGETSHTVAVEVKGDTVPERDEVLYVLLSDAVNATIADPQATVTITDDDETVAISDVRVAEPDPGTTEVAVLEVVLSAPSEKTVSVDFATVDGSAVAGEDYEPVDGTLTFRPGDAALTISVKIRSDLVATQDQRFYVELLSASNARIERARGEVIIVNLDRVVAILDTNVWEPDPGAERLAHFEVQLAQPTAGSEISSGFPGEVPISVDFETADGTAIADLDYIPTRGTLFFPPGVASQLITVPVLNDNMSGPNKRFTVNLFNPKNAFLADAAGAAVIFQNDRTIVIEDTSVLEGDGGGVVARFPVTLSAPSPIPVLVRFFTEPRTALAGADFVPQTGVIEFAPGEVTRTIDVPIVSDVADDGERPETFSVVLADPEGAQLARGLATGTIFDDDVTISLSEPTIITEGDEGTTEAVFTVSLSSSGARGVEVGYVTVDGSATAPQDFVPQSGTLVFAPYEGSKSIRVPVVGDLVAEPHETFSVRLANPVGAEIRRAEAVATIGASDDGYWLTAADGGVFSFGDARFRGSAAGTPPKGRVVGMAPTPSGAGYWLATADGAVLTFGDARSFGSAATRRSSPKEATRTVAGITATPSGNGYWLVGVNGEVLAFGDAGSFGSAPVRRGTTAVGMVATPTGEGYWVGASDGAVFAFGDAVFHGSASGLRLNQPIVGIAAASSGSGYWLVASDGGVFTFGDAHFWGSCGDLPLNRPIVGLTPVPGGNGYWLVASDGGIFAFGGAPFRGSTGGSPLRSPVVGMAPLTGRTMKPLPV